MNGHGGVGHIEQRSFTSLVIKTNKLGIFFIFLRKERCAISQQRQDFNVQEKNKVQNLFRERLRKNHSPDLQKMQNWHGREFQLKAVSKFGKVAAVALLNPYYKGYFCDSLNLI